jgi:Spy/CpxP family protein refolding chaperone
MHNTKSDYSDLVTRKIKSLSEKDIEILKRGRGGVFGGMAILAELNRHPGPIHVLELGEKLNLTDEQREQTQQIYDEMEEKAKELGEEFIKIEKTVNDGFANANISEEQLKELMRKSGELWGELRFTHLRCHLGTKKLLTPDQVHKYDVLRGYSNN